MVPDGNFADAVEQGKPYSCCKGYRRTVLNEAAARIGRGLAGPVDGASLAVVRIAVGLMGAASVLRLWWLDRIGPLFADAERHLAYAGMEWVPDPGPAGVRMLSVGVLVAAVLLIAGWHTRVSAAAFAVGFTWFEALEASTYLNHYWLVSLLAVLLVFVPAGRALSLDARARGHGTDVWVLAIWLVRAQLALVYLFAGIAKLHPDWLIDAMPLRLWLPARGDLPLVGDLLTEAWVAYAASWAGAAFDLCIGPLLLWRRTRTLAWVAVVGFHLSTLVLFPSIGLFPFVMIGASTVFLAPDWPRRFLGARRPRMLVRRDSGHRLAPLAVAAAALWLCFQVAIPLRHLAIPGDARWTGDGYLLSWNVLAMEKAGSVVFRVSDGTSSWLDDGSDVFSDQQLMVAAADPWLIHQMAHAVGDRWSDGSDIAVFADAFVSVNGRSPVRLIDPTVDLYALDLSAPTSAYVAAPP
jgi:vitamin K-dependent gamma-carboxylase